MNDDQRNFFGSVREMAGGLKDLSELREDKEERMMLLEARAMVMQYADPEQWKAKAIAAGDRRAAAEALSTLAFASGQVLRLLEKCADVAARAVSPDGPESRMTDPCISVHEGWCAADDALLEIVTAKAAA